MPRLPIVLWLAAAGTALLLLGLSAATAYAVLRAGTRARLACWPAWRMLGLLLAAMLPWLVVRLAPIRVVVNVRGLGPLIGWLLVALLAFGLLVLLPLAALLSGALWWMEQRRGARTSGPRAPP
jgi:hypothetical protein